MNVLITHPGRQHSHQAALALARAGMLAGYWSGVPAVAEQAHRVPRRLRRLFARYGPVALDPRLVRWQPLTPGLRRLGDRLLPPRGAAWIDLAACRLFDRWAAARLRRAGLLDAVIACEISALSTFLAARRAGIVTILDAPSLHHAAQDRLHGTTDPPRLHHRITAIKDREIALADHILTVSELARETYLEAGVPAARVHAVPLGADLELFTPAAADAARGAATPPADGTLGESGRRGLAAAPRVDGTAAVGAAAVGTAAVGTVAVGAAAVGTVAVGAVAVGTAAAGAADRGGPAAGGGEAEFRFLFCGAAIRRKGFDLLLDAFERVRQTAPEVRLRVVGPSGAAAAGLAAGGGMGITLTGPVGQRELADELRRADCLVLPSRNDSYGMVVPEALACGLPVLISDMVGAKELVEPGRNGWIVPAGDAAPLAEQMIWCARHAAAVRGMRPECRRSAEAATWPAYHQRLAALLRSVLAAGSAA
jgi:glycosyltransferase involved in cell wall biosynthesis